MWQTPAPRDYWPTAQWRNAPPEEHGMDSARLALAERYVAERPTEAFLVVRHGYLVGEWYYGDFGPATMKNGYSIGKSFTGAAVGAAILEGRLQGLHQPLSDFIPPPRPIDDSVGRTPIRIEHLLTMTSGIDWRGARDHVRLSEQYDWLDYVLRKAVTAEPGTTWNYSGADPTLLSAVVARATGLPMAEYARTRLFAPIGMDGLYWQSDPLGMTCGYGGVHTTARNYARLGFLYLNDGMWDGARLLPEEWAAETSRPCRSPLRTPLTFATDDGRRNIGTQRFQNRPFEYGLAWWCQKLAGVPDDAYNAYGGHGQWIVVVPGLDLVVVRLGHGVGLDEGNAVLAAMMRLVVESVTEH